MTIVRNGYLMVNSGCRKAGRLKKGVTECRKNRIKWKDHFFVGSKTMSLSTLSFPKYYLGKRIKFKVIVVE